MASSPQERPANPDRLDTRSDVSMVAPFNPRPRRETAVRLCLPGLDDPGHRIGVDTAFPLTNTLVDGLSQAPHVKELELLAISGERQQEYFLTPRLRSAPENSRAVPIQTSVSDFAGQQPTVPDSTADKLASVAAKTLPEEIGIEICDVDLSPIRMWPVTTGRVLLETNGALRQSHFDWTDPFVETVVQLAGVGRPFVVQLLVGTGARSGYVLTLRYAVIHPAYAITSARAEGEHLEDAKQQPVERIWHSAGLKTNYDLPIDEFARPSNRTIRRSPVWIESYPVPSLQERRYMTRSDSRTALDLYTGTTEYRALFHGRPAAPKLYEKLDLHARIPVNEYTLRLFGSVVPLYYETSPWVGVAGRAGPAINTRTVVRSAPGTEHAHGHTNHSATERHSSGYSVTAGSESHEQLLAFAVEYFEGQGDEAWIESQDGGSRADGGRRPASGTRRELEVEFAGLSKPANPLTNYARAMTHERPVDFVVTNQQKATQLSETLRTPWKDVTDHGTHLHNMTTTVDLPTGQQPVLPAKAAESNWYLDPAGTLTLRDEEGSALASGPATASVRTFEYETPRYDDSDGSHRIVDADGATKASYDTRSQVLDDWTLVHAPFVPGDLHCLANAGIYYQAGDELVEFDEQASWDRTAEAATDRYRAGLVEFVDTYTCESETTLSYADFQRHCQALFAVRSRHDPPNKTHIGRALPDTLTVDPPGTADRHVTNRALIYPPGLVSPDLPFVDADESGDAGDEGDEETDGESDDKTA